MNPAFIREMLESSGEIRLQVGGQSMLPLIPNRSVVVIRGVPPEQVRVGDVAMVWTGPDSFRLHRVLRIYQTPAGKRFLVKGDCRLSPDGWFAGESLRGVVTRIRLPRWAGGFVLPQACLRWIGIAAARLSLGAMVLGAPVRPLLRPRD